MHAADLDEQLSEQRDRLHELRRAGLDLSHEYDDLDASRLGVDELGDPITPDVALASARSAIADVDRALALATDAMWRSGTRAGSPDRPRNRSGARSVQP